MSLMCTKERQALAGLLGRLKPRQDMGAVA